MIDAATFFVVTLYVGLNPFINKWVAIEIYKRGVRQKRLLWKFYI